MRILGIFLDEQIFISAGYDVALKDIFNSIFKELDFKQNNLIHLCLE